MADQLMNMKNLITFKELFREQQKTKKSKMRLSWRRSNIFDLWSGHAFSLQHHLCHFNLDIMRILEPQLPVNLCIKITNHNHNFSLKLPPPGAAQPSSPRFKYQLALCLLHILRIHPLPQTCIISLRNKEWQQKALVLLMISSAHNKSNT